MKQIWHNNIIKLALVLFIFSTVFEIEQALVYGAPDQVANSSFIKSINFEQSYKISNITSYYQSFYLSEKTYDVTADIDLSIIISNTAKPDISSITIYANEVPVFSSKFDELINNSGKMVLSINGQYFKSGKNTISIKGYIKSSEKDCEKNEEINWALINKDSHISIHYSLEQIQFISEFYDGTYFFENQGGKIILAVPDQMTDFDYTLCATIASLLGNHFKAIDPDFKIETIPYSKLNSLGHSAIVLGTRSAISDYFFAESIQNTNNSQPPTLSIQPINGVTHFFAIIDNEQQLENFTEIFQKPDLYGQLNVSDYSDIIISADIPPEIPFSSELKGTISEIGYENSNVVGSGRQIFQYYIDLPGKYAKLKESSLKLLFSYSENIDFSDSYVTVLINDQPVKTASLTKENAEQDSIDFSIPEAFYDYSGYNITLDFNLSKNSPCESTISEGAWVEIDTHQSIYQFQLEKRNTFSLFTSNHFVQNHEGFVDGEILVHFPEIELTDFLNFSSYLGQKAAGVHILKVTQKQAVPEQFSGFIIGMPDSPLIQSMNHNLLFPYSSDGSIIANDLFQQVNPSLGVIQISNDTQSVVITGNDSLQLNHVLNYYTKGIERFDKQIITVDETVLSRFGVPTKEEEKTDKKGILFYLNDYRLFIGIAVIALVSLLFFAIAIHRKNKF